MKNALILISRFFRAIWDFITNFIKVTVIILLAISAIVIIVLLIIYGGGIMESLIGKDAWEGIKFFAAIVMIYFFVKEFFINPILAHQANSSARLQQMDEKLDRIYNMMNYTCDKIKNIDDRFR